MHKMVLSIQDLKTKDGNRIAIVSGDVYYIDQPDVIEGRDPYETTIDEIEAEKNEQKKSALEKKLKEMLTVASFQMSLDSSIEFKRCIASLAEQAIQMKEKKK